MLSPTINNNQFKLFKKSLTWLILLCAIALSVPPFKQLIATSMAIHMLVQMPLLVLAGYLIMAYFTQHQAESKQYPLAVSAAQWLWIYLSTMFWMLPISLDKALIYPAWDAFKILSLLITGAILKVVFQSHRLLALFFIGSIVMMLFFAGFNYQQSDIRLCNAYLIQSQQITGVGLIIIASSLLLFLFWQVKLALANLAKH